MVEDFADRHVAQWRDHWIDVSFDGAVEAAVVRIGKLNRYLREAKQAAAAEVGLGDFEYETLHSLMIRDTPGRATPGDLATEVGVSPAGMTGRLDTMERAGYVARVQSRVDRRQVDVQVTPAGLAVWRRAMALRGKAEDEMMANLTTRDLATLNRLLKKLTLHTERRSAPDAGGGRRK